MQDVERGWVGWVGLVGQAGSLTQPRRIERGFRPAEQGTRRFVNATESVRWPSLVNAQCLTSRVPRSASTGTARQPGLFRAKGGWGSAQGDSQRGSSAGRCYFAATMRRVYAIGISRDEPTGRVEQPYCSGWRGDRVPRRARRKGPTGG
jgi:hypothetical protein